MSVLFLIHLFSPKCRRFDIKWTAPTAEGSFNDARGDIIISHDFITLNSASAAFDLYMRVQTSYPDDFHHKREEFSTARAIPFTVDGVELDLRMRGFEFFSLVPAYAMDSPRPLQLKAAGRIKFQGKVLKPNGNISEQNFEMTRQHVQTLEKGIADSLVGEVSISGLKLNQLMLAPQLSGLLRVSPERIKVMQKIISSKKCFILTYYGLVDIYLTAQLYHITLWYHHSWTWFPWKMIEFNNHEKMKSW